MEEILEFLDYLKFKKTQKHMFKTSSYFANKRISYQKYYNNFLYRIMIIDNSIIYIKEEKSNKSGNLNTVLLDENFLDIKKILYNYFPILLRKRKIEKILL